LGSPPATRYAQSDGLNIAYQVVGDGPIDLVFVPGFVSHLDLQWGDPAIAAFLERLASFARLIIFDKRGTGLSDPAPRPPTLEERMHDVSAVMDAVGSEHAALFGYSEGGMMSMLFAATYPERTDALVLYGAYADPDATNDGWRRIRAAIDSWGEGSTLAVLAPSLADGAIQQRLRGLFERAAASPGMARSLVDSASQMDVTDVLPSIRVQTLLVHRRDDVLPIKWSREIASRIPGARLVEQPGSDHMPWVGDADAVLDEIEDFLTGARHGPPPDRVLATVLFTDIVGSTELAARLGDERWRQQLEAHYSMFRHELDRYGGQEIADTGDGFESIFNGPTSAIRCAQAVSRAAPEHGIEIRCGVHTGECERAGSRMRGLAVHVGARIAAVAAPGEILVSRTVVDLAVGSRIAFVDRGEHVLKGVPGEWQLFAVDEKESGTEPYITDSRKVGTIDRGMTEFVRRAPVVTQRFVRLTRRQRRP